MRKDGLLFYGLLFLMVLAGCLREQERLVKSRGLWTESDLVPGTLSGMVQLVSMGNGSFIGASCWSPRTLCPEKTDSANLIDSPLVNGYLVQDRKLSGNG